MNKEEKILFIGNTQYNNVFMMIECEIYKRYIDKGDYKIDICKQNNIFEIEHISNYNFTLIVILLRENDFNDIDQLEKYLNNLLYLFDFENLRLVINTIPPCTGKKKLIKKFNVKIKEFCLKYEVKLANFYHYWKYYNLSVKSSSEEDFTDLEEDVMKKALFPIVSRSKILVLWQYNGRYAHCNYSCPYCYVATSVNKGYHLKKSIEEWEEAFKKHFLNKNIVFYFSYGEPLMGGSYFYELLEMISKYEKWEARITSNVSVNLDRLLNSTLAKTKRLNINASFHPTQTSIEKFLEKCNQIRMAGIEPSIVYVMYPEQMNELEKYIDQFKKFGYRVHIRAFRGMYKFKKYPKSYTKEQWMQTARFMDEYNFKYQLSAVNALGRLSFIGVSHILIDNYGKIEMCDSYVGNRKFGNIFDDKIYLDIEPTPFPGLIPLAAVDDIADYVELQLNELEDNNITSYIEQGNVTREANGKINYPYEKTSYNELVEIQKNIPKPQVKCWKFWLNPKWFYQHFIYSYLIKKYGKYILAWGKGKINLIRIGKLDIKNFWHG